MPRTACFESGSGSTTINTEFKIYESVTIEFWMLMFDSANRLGNLVGLYNDNNLAIGVSYEEVSSLIAMRFSGIAPDIELKNSLANKKWVHIAAASVFIFKKAYLSFDGNIGTSSSGSVISSIEPIDKSIIVIGPISNGEVGLKDIRVWSLYKAPGETEGLKYSRPAGNNPGLGLYLPLDKSSGKQIYERVSQQKITANNFAWKHQNSLNVNEEYFSNSYRENMAMGSFITEVVNDGTTISPVNSEMKTNLPADISLHSEFTIMFWIMVGHKRNFILNIYSKTCFHVEIVPKLDVYVDNFYVKPRTDIYATTTNLNTWMSFTFVASVGSYNNPQFKRIYINGSSVNVIESEVDDNKCYEETFNTDNTPGPTNYHFLENTMTIRNSEYGSLAFIKEIKVIGGVLSPIEMSIEAFRKTNTWKYITFLRHYWPLDEYPSYDFNDYGINHLNQMYHFTTLDSTKMNTKIPQGSNMIWISNAPTSRCEGQDFYDIKLKKCFSPNKSLMFIKGRTHSITFQTVSFHKNLTIEFWINIKKEETGLQEIIRAQHLTVSYQEEKFSFNLFNEIVYEDEGIKSTTDKQS